jgi:hypothetical protein
MDPMSIAIRLDMLEIAFSWWLCHALEEFQKQED